MYNLSDYLERGQLFLRNQLFPSHKRLSNLMIYATDLCDSGCKHCLIWAKRPVSYLSKEKIFEIVGNNACITDKTTIGLEGGEFMLHPDALEIMQWFTVHHPKFDLLSNCLKPDQLIDAVKRHTPSRLWISLDGDKDTYLYMRGKDGYDSVLKVIKELKEIVPISVMFTLSPYNDFTDMEHVAGVCKQYGVDLRVGVYNNISFFDTVEEAHTTGIGLKKDDEKLTLKTATSLKTAATLRTVAALRNSPPAFTGQPPASIDQAAPAAPDSHDFSREIPQIISEFSENYDFLILYDQWRKKNLQLKCFSIFDSGIILPNGDVPICQNLDLKLGNIHDQSLDSILQSAATIEQQKWHSNNCNKCWINYHRKYDVVLYRTFEKFFGRWTTKKVFGYYQWEEDSRKSYEQATHPPE